MSNLQTHCKNLLNQLKRLPVKYLLGIAIPLCLIGLIGTGIAWSDYHTNWLAKRLGSLLYATNYLRPQTGSIWQRIEAQTRTRESIDENDAVSLTDIQTGLPDPVRKNRFEIETIPETGPPGYLALWKTPLPGVDLNDRPLSDIITSRKTYQKGLELIRALELPDVHFHTRVRQRVDQLYAQLGDLTPLPADTLINADGDTLEVLAPDSLRAAVFDELAANIIPQLKRTEHQTLVQDFQNGRIAQIILNRDLGRYRGELYRDLAPTTPIPFTIPSHQIARIFNVSLPDTTAQNLLE